MTKGKSPQTEINEVKAKLRKLLKYENPQNLLEGLITATELCALLLNKQIKIVVVPAE